MTREMNFWVAREKRSNRKNHGIKARCATTANLQLNSTFKRIHQVIANFIHIYDLQKKYLDEHDPRSEILAATAFEVLSMYHTTLQAMPYQLVLERDIIFNTPFIADW